MAAFGWDWVESLKRAAIPQQVPAEWTAHVARNPDDPWRADAQRSPKSRRTRIDVSPACSPVATQDLWRPVSCAHEPSALPILESSRQPSPAPTSIPACFSPHFPPSAQQPLPLPAAPAHVSPPVPAAAATVDTVVRRSAAVACGEPQDAATEVLLQALLTSAPASRRLAALGLVLLLGGEGQRSAGHEPARGALRLRGPDQSASPCSSVGSCDAPVGDDHDDTACTTAIGVAEPCAELSSQECTPSASLAASHAADPMGVGSKRRRVDSYASLATAQDTWQSAQEVGRSGQEREVVAGSGAGEEAQGAQTEEFWQQQRQQLVEAIQALLHGCAPLRA